MAYLLFVDESGQDRVGPYEVLAGVSVEDSRVWPLITAIHDAEVLHFGQRVTLDSLELKARKLLKTKTFKHAAMLRPMVPEERARFAQAALREGAEAKAAGRPSRHTQPQLVGLAQAKLAFVSRLLEVCAQHQVKAFASIVDRDAERPSGDFLRKDYAYLFERFYYFLEEQNARQYGLVIFDEIERSASHILIGQMDRYFQGTAKGRLRASRVLPEPLFVHSDLTSIIQVADIVAYVISWGLRYPPRLTRPGRPELKPFADAVFSLRHRVFIEQSDGRRLRVGSFKLIEDLRSLRERGGRRRGG